MEEKIAKIFAVFVVGGTVALGIHYLWRPVFNPAIAKIEDKVVSVIS